MCDLLERRRRAQAASAVATSLLTLKIRQGHDRRCAIDSSKMRRELGWEEGKFDIGIERTIDWYLQSERWWQPIRRERCNGKRFETKVSA
jgi:dTDP-glucose 4,6-dehydratase